MKKRILQSVMIMVFAISIVAVNLHATTNVATREGVDQHEQQNSVAHLVPVNGMWCAFDDYGNFLPGFTGLACNEYGWFYMSNGMLDNQYTGLVCNEFGWFYVQNGAINWNYTGLASNEYGWWYVNQGVLDFGYTGPAWNEYGWWYVTNGALDFGYTGMGHTAYGWFYFTNGSLDGNYTGMAYNEYGWWYMINGSLADWYTGIANNAYGSWYYENGRIAFDYTGMFKDSSRWYYIQNGQVSNYTGLAHNDWGWWYFENGNLVEHYTGMAFDGTYWRYLRNGDIDPIYTGMAEYNGAWWYFKNGVLDFNYTGIGRNPYGTWYIKNGTVDFDYTGSYVDNEVTYSVKNGSAKAIAAKNIILGVFFNSREDATDSLYASFDGYDFWQIGEAYKNAFPNIEENNIATISPSLLDPSDPEYDSNYVVNVLRDPSIFYRDGVFWMVGGYVIKDTFYPMLGYSTDLVNWSFPSSGTDAAGRVPTLVPLNKNNVREYDYSRTDNQYYDAVAVDFLNDDDGTVWLVVSCGYYGDDGSNRMSCYIMKATGLTAPVTSEQLKTTAQKKKNSVFDVSYSALTPINLPGDGTPTYYDYDCSLYKENGKYYLVTQNNGEEDQIWSIKDLNQASNASAWTLVNKNAISGHEGPFITKYNGKYFLYTDRFGGWNFHDYFGDTYGIFAHTSDSLSKTFTESVRIRTRNNKGEMIPNRHGTAIAITDPNAVNIILQLYNTQY